MIITKHQDGANPTNVPAQNGLVLLYIVLEKVVGLFLETWVIINI